MSVNISTQPLTRAQIATISNDPRVIQALESLFQDTSATIPDAINVNQAAIDQAAQAAADANAAAAAAQGTATAAQAAAAGLALPQYLVLTADDALTNERILAFDPVSFKTVDAGAGAALTVSSSDLAAILAADVVNSTTGFVSVGTLNVTLLANAVYMVEGVVTFQAAATTTGIGLAFTIPGGATIAGAYSHVTTGTTVEGAYNTASGTVSGDTSGVPVANANTPLTGRWLISTGATAGAAQLQFRSEVAASAITIKAGLSSVVARRLS